MTFEEYLTKRRVNVAAFAAGEPQRFAEWQNWFGQMHPESFYMLVKMVLNDVRRNYWLAEVPKPVIAATSDETASAPARPAGRRAAIARPATAVPAAQKSETTVTEAPEKTAEISETKPAEATPTETGSSAETSAPKPGRPVFKPRAIIKKPTETPAEEKTAETPEIGNVAEASSVEIKPSEEIKPTSENPEAAPAKPARPRAVIKRPAALSGPKTTPAETLEKPASTTSETLGETAEKVQTENTSEAPKPSRPRPVFKRPASPDSTEKPVTETEKTLGETSEKPEVNSETETPTENPVAKPGQEGASEAKAVSEEIQKSPEAAKSAEEVAAAAGHVPKPPRPRPVFKRPATPKPPENEISEPEKTLSLPKENPVLGTAEHPAETPGNSEEKPENKTVGDSEEKVENAAPKPPRPRPVFKRPAKPESDKDNPQ